MTDYPITANLDLVNEDDVTAYLDALYQYVDWEPQHIVALRPQGEKGTDKEGKPGGDVWLQPGMIGEAAFRATVLQWVRAWAQHHQAAFLIPAVLNRASGNADAVGLFTSVVVDLDKGDTDAALGHAIQHIGMPSMIVQSGGVTETNHSKLHLYFLLTEPTNDVPAVMALRDMLAVKLGGDKALGVPATDRTGLGRAHQPIRIPGSVHSKGGVSKTVMITAHGSEEYELDDLAARIGDMPVCPGVTPPSAKPLDSGQPGLGLAGLGQGGFSSGFTFGPGEYSFAAQREEIGAALSGEINEGGDGDRNRWTEFSRVAGHYLREARDGVIDLNTAVDLTRGWMQAKMHPSWPEDRFQREFKALYQRDQREASKIALAEAKGAVPLVSTDSGNFIPTLEAFGAQRWKGRAKPPRRFIVKGLLMPGKHHMLVADGGVGKTYMALELAVKMAAPREGDLWLGQPVNPDHCGAVVMLTAEDDTDEVISRFHELDVMDRVDEATAAGRLYVVPTLEAGGSFPLVAREKDGTPKLSPRWEYWLNQIAQVQGLKMVILDTFNAFNHGEENSATTINELVQGLTVICGRLGAAVLVIHHVRKAGENPIQTPDDMLNAVRGSGAITASFRAVLGVWHESDYERILKAAGEATPRDKTLYRAAVIKGNNPELMRDVSYLKRTETGFLQDVTGAMIAATRSGDAEARAWVAWVVKHSDAAGHPLSRKAHYDRRAAWPTKIRSLSRAEFEHHVNLLVSGGALVEIVGPHGGQKALAGALVRPDSPFLLPVPPEPGTGRYKLAADGVAYDAMTGEIVEGGRPLPG